MNDRIEEDALALAQLIYDIYIESKDNPNKYNATKEDSELKEKCNR